MVIALSALRTELRSCRALKNERKLQAARHQRRLADRDAASWWRFFLLLYLGGAAFRHPSCKLCLKSWGAKTPCRETQNALGVTRAFMPWTSKNEPEQKPFSDCQTNFFFLKKTDQGWRSVKLEFGTRSCTLVNHSRSIFCQLTNSTKQLLQTECTSRAWESSLVSRRSGKEFLFCRRSRLTLLEWHLTDCGLTPPLKMLQLLPDISQVLIFLCHNCKSVIYWGPCRRGTLLWHLSILASSDWMAQ